MVRGRAALQQWVERSEVEVNYFSGDDVNEIYQEVTVCVHELFMYQLATLISHFILKFMILIAYNTLGVCLLLV